MKVKIGKLVVFIALTVLGSSFIAAQPISQTRYFGLSSSKNLAKRIVNYQSPESALPVSKIKKVNAEGGNKLTVKLKFADEYANDEMPSPVSVGNKNMKYAEWVYVRPGETEAVFQNLSPGTYDITATFSGDETHPDKLVIKENVVVNSDTEVTLSSDDATVHLQFDLKNLSGEDFTVDEAELSEDGMSATVIQKGNSREFSVSNSVLPKEYSGGFIFNNYILGDLYRDFDIRRKTDLYVSPLSDRWLITTVCTVEDNDHNIYIVKYRHDGVSESKSIANDPSRFIAYKESFTQSPIGKKSGESQRFGHEELAINGGYLNGGTRAVGTVLPSDGIAKFYVDALDDTELKSPTWQVRLKPVFIDFQDATNSIDRFLEAVPVNITKEGANYEIVGDLSSEFYYEQGPFYLQSIYKPHKAFSYSAAQKAGSFGGNAPIAFITQSSIVGEDGTKSLGFSGYDYVGELPNTVSYIGRFGEKRSTDLDSIDFSLKYDGKEILANYGELAEFSQQWDSEKHADSTYNLSVLNENIEVDGLKGKNYTTVDFDFRKEDRIAPILTMLQFRSNSGFVTERFENASDGKIMLSAGDFTCHYIPEQYGNIFTCKKANVTVEYSPYGKEAWQPLDIEENAEYYQDPGFGNYYEGSLSQIGTKGWHDVRITVADDAGNRQQQIISPAFKIGNSASVAAVDSDNGIYAYLFGKSEVRIVGTVAASVNVYNASGTLVAYSADGVSNPVSVSSLPEGVYVAIVSVPGKKVIAVKLVK